MQMRESTSMQIELKYVPINFWNKLRNADIAIDFDEDIDGNETKKWLDDLHDISLDYLWNCTFELPGNVICDAHTLCEEALDQAEDYASLMENKLMSYSNSSSSSYNNNNNNNNNNNQKRWNYVNYYCIVGFGRRFVYRIGESED